MSTTTKNRTFPQQKAALTRAINSKDPQKVIDEVNRTYREWDTIGLFNKAGKQVGGPGVYPDDWARWERARDDAELERARKEW